MKDGIFFVSFIPPVGYEKIQYHYYDHSTKIISEVTGDTQSDIQFDGAMTQISDNSFLFGADKKQFVGTIINNELKIRVLDKFPPHIYANYGKISDNQVFASIEIIDWGGDKPIEEKQLKIVWKDKTNN